MTYLLDTDWAIQAIVGQEPTASTLAALLDQQVSVCWVTVAEIYDGAFSSPDPAAHLASLRRFLSPYPVIPLTDEIAERFAEIRAYLRRRGERIPDFDLVIGATALQHGLTVLTFNRRHFARIPHLALYHASWTVS